MSIPKSKIILAEAVIAVVAIVAIWGVYQIRSRAQDEAPVARKPKGPSDASEETPGNVSAASGTVQRTKTDKAPEPPLSPKATKADVKPLPPTPDIVRMQDRAMDPKLTEQERMAAIRGLRPYGRTGFSPQVLSSMSQLLISSQEDSVRSDICKLLRGHDSPDYRQVLISAARSDVSAKVRSEAVESLGLLAADPIVKQTLTTAYQTEQDPKVIQQLKIALKIRK